jgi:hypothetical protein
MDRSEPPMLRSIHALPGLMDTPKVDLPVLRSSRVATVSA